MRVYYYGEKRPETKGIIIHHFGVDAYYNRVDLQLIAIQHAKETEPEELYHYIILTDGSIIKGNEEGIVVYHANNNYWNNVSIAVCLWGNLSKKQPTEAQIKALIKLLIKLVAKYKIHTNNIKGHCDVGDAYTECPGLHLYGKLKWIRNIVEKEVYGMEKWKEEAFNTAIERRWHTDQDNRTPATNVDLGLLDAILINFFNWMIREGYIQKPITKEKAEDIGKTIAQVFISELRKLTEGEK